MYYVVKYSKTLMHYRVDSEGRLLLRDKTSHTMWTESCYSDFEELLMYNNMVISDFEILFEGNNDKEYNKYLMGLEMLR